MKPTYIDLHIHTSEDPNNLNKHYDVNELLDRVKELSQGSDFLLSLTDHNAINEKAYLDILELTSNVILGVELHIKNYEDAPPYHCHAFFNASPIEVSIIQNINSILDKLYPNKLVADETTGIPKIEDIIRSFDAYDFLLLPHGGQSHRTFDKSIPRDRDVVFDTTLERSIYYNQFDGFTARSNNGLEETKEYFKRLGINEFVNLITCSDNYEPTRYPETRADNASSFLPTWMYATPVYEGLRIALSESTRLIYSNTAPDEWTEYINRVVLENQSISIDVTLTPGLNVVIGGSSSGKTLFVDSIFKKLDGDFSRSDYLTFGIESISVINPAGTVPHYINQNFITTILSDPNKDINNIDIVEKVFPIDRMIDERVRRGLAGLKADLGQLITAIKDIDNLESNLRRIPVFSRLITNGTEKNNPFDRFLPSDDVIESFSLSETQLDQYFENIDEIGRFLRNNAFVNNMDNEIRLIKEELSNAFNMSVFENEIRTIINSHKRNMDEFLKTENHEMQTKKEDKDKLFQSITNYFKLLDQFHSILQKISEYNIVCETQTIQVAGHTLSIENSFILSKEMVLSVINRFLKNENRISSFDAITAQSLFIDRFSKRTPKIDKYEEIEKYIYDAFEKQNKKIYKIITKDGDHFESISPGWKTAVLLDIILGYDDDMVPLIIDQPEDNLATNYINNGLIDSIKRVKTKKQIILVSHNATIPMLGDAQNVILCRNNGGKITIRSSPLEGFIDGKSMVDYIAEITDGGKSSIKKRVKKYNLKSFKEETKWSLSFLK